MDTNGDLDLTLTCKTTMAVQVTSYAWNGPCMGQTTSSCVFKPRPPQDEGRKITCTMTSSDGRVGSGELTVQLNYPPDKPPTIHGVSKDTVYQEGQKLTMTCSVQGGKPLVKAVIFFCGTHPDSSSDIVGASEVHSILSIRALTMGDNGQTCICTAMWKDRDWYRLSDTARLAVNGRQQPTPEGLNIVAIAAGCSGAVVAIIIIIVIVVIVRRRPEPVYDNAGKEQDSSSVYSVIKPPDQSIGPPAPPYGPNVTKCSIDSQKDDTDSNSHYEKGE
ncbi:hypothetical protein ACOMHN_006521 [Nucella lapillus]